MLDQFILDKTQPAMALDALVSSHPINVAVHDPYEIETIFDTISYNKVSTGNDQYFIKADSCCHKLFCEWNYYVSMNGLESLIKATKKFRAVFKVK